MNLLKALYVSLIIMISSLTFAQQSPIPCSNPANPPGETCCLATPICDFNGYCGRTLSTYTPDAWPELKLAIKNATLSLGGLDWLTIENDSYLKFMASSSTISFNVYVYDCLGLGTKAIQVVFFSTASCSSGAVNVVYANAQMNQQAAPHAVSVTGLVPGNVYYILIDGYSNKNCGYTFEAVAGVEVPEVVIDIAPTATVCLGGNITTSVTGGTSNNYTWSGDPGLSSTSGSTVTITPPTTPGTYTYTAAASAGTSWCPNNSSDVLSIIVPSPITFSNVATGPCVANAYSVSGTLQTATTPTTGNLVLEDYNGNQTIIALAPFSGTSFPFNLTGLDADGSNCTLTAFFTATNCPEATSFIAPAPCTGCGNVTITYAANSVNTGCGTSVGSISLVGAGGTAPYSYSIDNGFTFVSSGTFNNLPAGTYTVHLSMDKFRKHSWRKYQFFNRFVCWSI